MPVRISWDYSILVESGKEKTIAFLDGLLNEGDYEEIGNFLFFAFVTLEEGDGVRVALEKWYDDNNMAEYLVE